MSLPWLEIRLRDTKESPGSLSMREYRSEQKDHLHASRKPFWFAKTWDYFSLYSDPGGINRLSRLEGHLFFCRRFSIRDPGSGFNDPILDTLDSAAGWRVHSFLF